MTLGAMPSPTRVPAWNAAGTRSRFPGRESRRSISRARRQLHRRRNDSAARRDPNVFILDSACRPNRRNSATSAFAGSARSRRLKTARRSPRSVQRMIDRADVGDYASLHRKLLVRRRREHSPVCPKKSHVRSCNTASIPIALAPGSPPRKTGWRMQRRMGFNGPAPTLRKKPAPFRTTPSMTHAFRAWRLPDRAARSSA